MKKKENSVNEIPELFPYGKHSVYSQSKICLIGVVDRFMVDYHYCYTLVFVPCVISPSFECGQDLSFSSSLDNMAKVKNFTDVIKVIGHLILSSSKRRFAWVGLT